jgi:hypothetical protein
MTQKLLEVYFGADAPSKKFPLHEISENTFMLATKDSLTDLVGTCTHWLQQNFMMIESCYQDIINLRSGLTLTPTLPTLQPKTKGPDNLFIGCDDGTLLQYSIAQQKIIKNYGKLGEKIFEIKTTPDKKNLFVCS